MSWIDRLSEDVLTQAIASRAPEYDCFGYRRATALLKYQGWAGWVRGLEVIEAQVISTLAERMDKALSELRYHFEIVTVDDGSEDVTLEELDRWSMVAPFFAVTPVWCLKYVEPQPIILIQKTMNRFAKR